MAALGRTLHSGRFLADKRKLEVMARRALGLFERYDVLLTPTLGQLPPLHGQLRARGPQAWAQQLLGRAPAGVSLAQDLLVKTAVHQVFQLIPFTPLSNITGQPSMSVPLHWNAQGLPVGTMFSARYGDEGTLFSLAGQLERARPWAQRRPPGAKS
jgi:amidase